MEERQKFCKKGVHHSISAEILKADESEEGSQTTLLLSDGKPAERVTFSPRDSSTSYETDTTLPGLSENSVARRRWLEGDESDDEEPSFENVKHSVVYNEQQTTSKLSTARKMLPRIGESGRSRKAFFSDPQSLCNRIKMSCSITPRRSSYSGISDEDDVPNMNKPSVQGTGLFGKGRGEKARLINADDFISSTKEIPIQRTLEFKKPTLTPWIKAKPFVGRPQSGQPRLSKKLVAEYSPVDMACVGSKIKTDLTSQHCDNRAQRAARKFRSIRAKSASVVEKTM